MPRRKSWRRMPARIPNRNLYGGCLDVAVGGRDGRKASASKLAGTGWELDGRESPRERGGAGRTTTGGHPRTPDDGTCRTGGGGWAKDSKRTTARWGGYVRQLEMSHLLGADRRMLLRTASQSVSGMISTNSIRLSRASRRFWSVFLAYAS